MLKFNHINALVFFYYILNISIVFFSWKRNIESLYWKKNNLHMFENELFLVSFFKFQK